MPRFPLDVCWITQRPSSPFSEDLSIFLDLALTDPLKFGLAFVGARSLESEPIIEAPNLEIDSLQYSQTLSVDPLTLSEDDVSAFASLLERLQVALGHEDEGELLG